MSQNIAFLPKVYRKKLHLDRKPSPNEQWEVWSLFTNLDEKIRTITPIPQW